jgi:two-component system sensor histidine kinase BarA
MTKYGLRAQVIIYTILPTILIGGLLAGYFTFNRHQDANKFLIDRAINISEPLAIASEYGIRDETRSILRRLISATHRKNSGMIKSIAVFDDKNQLFVTSNYHQDFQDLKLPNNKNIPEITTIKHLENSIIIYSPIINEADFLEYQLTFDLPKKIIGYVSLEINVSGLELLLYHDASISLLVVLLGILFSLYLALKQAQRITAPISNMAKVVEKISLGRLNSRVKGAYSGEIQLLQYGINDMAVSISKHHEEMQESIDLATSELRETLDQMEVQNIQLDILHKEAQQANTVKSEFLANMSHELRTPLNGVIGFTRQLLKTEMTSSQIDYLQTIERSAGNLLNIINDILDFSKLEAGKLQLEMIPFNLRDNLNETLHLLAPSAHEKNIELSMMLDPEVPRAMVGDALRLQQILTNLIGNAIKFTQKGNVEVQIQKVENAQENEDKLTLKFMISDSGIGISKAHQSQLFKVFGQADSSVTRKYGGTGLGLVITKKLVIEMNGSIDLVSVENEGSTFWFTIEVEKSTLELPSPLPLEQLSTLRVLSFDKNTYAERACSQLLMQWNTYIDTADSQEQLFELLNDTSTANYDAVILGYNQVDNLAPLYEMISNINSKISNIIVLLNSSDPLLYETINNTAKVHCLSKPVNHKTLANALVFKKEMPRLITHNTPTPIQKKQLSVMAVDDNSANLKLISAMLADRVTNVVACVNGQEAVNQARKLKFDLIFMDIQMPVLDGISACHQIKKEGLNKETPVIAVSAHISAREKKQFLNQGMDDCLAKPIDEKMLQDAIAHWKPDAKNAKLTIEKPITSPLVSGNKNLSYDWELALKQAAGKPDLAVDMLKMLIAEFVEIRSLTQQALENKIDLSLFQKVIHRFHGGCSYAGVPKLKTIAGLLESELKQGTSLALLEPELFELLDELANVEEEAKQYLA